MIGLLNFSLLLKYLLLSVGMKILLWQPSDSFLAAPTITPMVICLGFCALLAATLATKGFFTARAPLCPPIVEPKHLLVLYWLCFGIGNAATFVIDYSNFGTVTMLDGTQVGGLMGVSRYVQPLRDISVGIALLYAHFKQSRKFITHPLVLLSAFAAIALSLKQNSKGLLMTPMFYGVLTLFLLRGFKQVRLFMLSGLAVLLLVETVFPVIHYVRAREFSESGYRLTLPLFWKSLTDYSFREELKQDAKSNYQENGYLGADPGIVARFAMVGNADNLIAPTAALHEFSGWLTIVWGLKMLPPRVLYPEKPTYDSSQELSIRSGMADPNSAGVPFAYGFFAAMYNAFGYLGALFGSFFLLLIFFMVAKLFFGNPVGPNLWCVFVVGWWHQGICEFSISGIISGLWYAPLAWVVYLASRWLTGRIPV